MGRELNRKRTDIQIYRALAVIAVILYHTNLNEFKNLYLGVDVFFVVSGYLMTILYLTTPYKIFIKKRLKRLAPSFILITVFFWAIITVQTIPLELKRIYVSLYSSYLGLSNVYFLTQQSYFDSNNYQPLLHLWSLSVEVQFYLLAPLLFILYKRNGIVRAFVTLMFSFLTYILTYFVVSEKIAFFLVFTRIWEFILGIIAGLIFIRNIPSVFVRRNTYFVTLSFVFLILGSILSVPNEGEYFRLVTCLAITFLLLRERKLSPRNKLVMLLVFIGNISYELYLVHFPLKAVMSYEPLTSNQSQDLQSFRSILVYLGATFILSLIVHKIVLRFDGFNWLKGLSTLVIFTLVVSSIFVFVPNLVYKPKEISVSKSLEDYDRRRCDWLAKLSNLNSLTCPVLNIDSPSKKVLLVGDSFANSIKPLIKNFAQSRNYNLYINKNNSRLIGDSLESTFDVAKSLKVNLMILHSSKNVSASEASRMKNLLLSNPQLHVVIIQPTPIFKFSIGKQVVNESRLESKPIVVYPRDLQNYADLGSPLEDSLERLRYLEIVSLLCPSYCVYSDKSGAALYFDFGHITNSGLKLLNPIDNQLQAALNSPRN